MPKKSKPLPPVQEVKCSTCPFRENSPTQFLALHLAESALKDGVSRICHSTGSNNAFHKQTGKPELLCRGARDVQLNYFAAIKFITEPTDEAWDAKWKEIQEKRNNETKAKAEAANPGGLKAVSSGRQTGVVHDARSSSSNGTMQKEACCNHKGIDTR